MPERGFNPSAYYVYLLQTCFEDPTRVYVGVTKNLARCLEQHY
jgi:predicted GIY-YIG superfamily endonuclease